MAARRIVVDFETGAIEPRPKYPPEPVGVALAELNARGRVVRARYLAWGHPTKNNTTRERAVAELRDLWRDDGAELIFHNAKFDLDVASARLGLTLPGWRRWHDTIFLLYLDDPRAPSLSLKPASARLLNLPPNEQDAVRAWLVERGVVRSNDKQWGARIADAPGDLVGAYAIGDVERTGALFHLLYKRVLDRGMGVAYDRERRIMPLLLDNETRGVRVNHPRLRRDVRAYQKAFAAADAWVRVALRTPELNVDADEDLADALARAGAVDGFALTKTGRRSTSMRTMRFHDESLRDALAYRGKLATSLRTFMEPWLAQADATGGVIHTNWNQVRGDNDKGTRTGRLSSNPNFQNLANEFKTLALPFAAPALPNLRGYVVPDDGDILLSRDYSQQELRALGHFEDGPLLRAYLTTPTMDLHTHAQRLINEMLGTRLERKPIKNMGFGLIYGMGLDRLADSMGVDRETAQRIKRAYLTIFPGLGNLLTDLKRRAALDQSIRTWGGREYYVEPQRMIDGQLRTFDYKLLNVLIQGSSADCTKEAMARFAEAAPRGRFLVQVHDQLLVSAPEDSWRATMKVLREAMESVEFDVPMLSDGSVGSSWADLKAIDDVKEKT